MKKFFIMPMLMISLCAAADESITLDKNGIEPQWEDFAPAAYVDVSEPKGLSRFDETASYWYKRKVDFDDAVQKCRETETGDEKSSCYQQIKVRQYQLNSSYNAKLEAMDRARLGPQEMYNRTDTMLPVGGYLNNFMRYQPNEIR